MIGYPIGFVSPTRSIGDRVPSRVCIANPLGFASPDPVPDTRSRFRVISPSLFLVNHPSPKRHLGDAPSRERWGWEC